MSLTYDQTLSLIHCATCGVPFGITDDMANRRRQDHRDFYCPAGHINVFNGKTEAEKQQERADRLERLLANRDESLRAERASHAVTKGQLTKARNRVAKTAEASK
ncbi:hypothetical protein A5784_30795 [Mycobacterium sp. 852013-50091_SCH5140682]|uniref:hypothetical protein n=1 Tax=Mycobacterium sp. 852013-50091_SCH5140682 TaxID=1834109 RepID=UPI0007EBF470|nr:hypothetical protein [Mycobacterium sp. 852013-50091_SCH5140682]OBC14090.1 hypothetical protein A5784_30795 [Mycobacterium sp. 852013-50091_SCH5140682]